VPSLAILVSVVLVFHADKPTDRYTDAQLSIKVYSIIEYNNTIIGCLVKVEK